MLILHSIYHNYLLSFSVQHFAFLRCSLDRSVRNTFSYFSKTYHAQIASQNFHRRIVEWKTEMNCFSTEIVKSCVCDSGFKTNLMRQCCAAFFEIMLSKFSFQNNPVFSRAKRRSRHYLSILRVVIPTPKISSSYCFRHILHHRN